MTSTLKMGMIAAVARLVAGCGDGGGSASVDAGADAGLDAPLCTLDCFLGVSCSAATIIRHSAPAVDTYPCDAQPPACPTASVVACPEGCIAEDISVLGGGPDVGWLCATAPPAQAGDACVTDEDCRPTFAVPLLSGPQVTQAYLRCGGTTCVAADAPVVAGFGGACSPGVGAGAGQDVAWVDDPVRGPGAACLVAASAACPRARATIVCAGDWECPADARCDRAVPRLDGAPATTGVCRTSALASDPSELPCEPAAAR